MSDKSSLRIITPTAILSYPHIDVPVQGTDAEGKPQGKPKYSGAFVFVPGSDLSAMKAAVMAAAEAKWPGKVQSMIEAHKKSIAAGGPFLFRLPFRADEKDGYPEGSIFVNARTETQPQCVYAYAGENNKPAPIPADKIASELYAGAKVRASLTAFAYDTKGNKGVSFALNNIQKIADGERLDNRKAATDEFTPDLSATPADLDSLLS